MSKQEEVIRQTKCWLKNVIIELNFCPFANREFINDTIRYHVCNDTKLENSLQCLADEFQFLDSNPATETSLLIFADAFADFNDFLDLIDYSNQLLDSLNYRSVYQLAHFHPDYCFEGVELDNASNYTNRSPFPTLHLIRENSLQAAIASHPDTSAIPETNIKLALQMGSVKMQALLNHCKKHH